MKSFFSKLLVFGLLVPSALFIVTGCKKDGDKDSATSHTHTYAEEWTYDATQHFKKATCEHTTEIKDASAHLFDGNRCSVCNYLNESVGLAYALNGDENGYTVVGLGTCTDSFITIPAQHEGKAVTGIAEYAFSNCYHLTRVEIPSSVTSIENRAFNNCYKLVEVINKSTHITVTKTEYENGGIGAYALEVFNADDTYVNKFETTDGYLTYNDGTDTLFIAYDGNETALTLPSQVTKIYPYALYRSTLVSATLPDGVTDIGAYAFYNCDRLTSVTLPNSVTTVGDFAFHSCVNLTSVTLGNGVTDIGSSAFGVCYKLVEIVNHSPNVTVTNAYLGHYALSISNCDDTYQTRVTTDTDGFILYDDDTDKIVVHYTGNQRNITLPNTANKIHDYAFYNNDTIQSAVIPDGVTDIGYKAFNDCSNLSSVTLGNGVQSIGEEAFCGCYTLVEVVNRSAQITVFKGNVWDGYIGFYAISVSNGDDTYQTRVTTNTDGFVLYDDGTDKILVGYIGTQTDIALPNGVTKIHNYAFYNNDTIQSAIIPDSVTDIGYKAFNDCSNLLSVKLGNGVTALGEESFSACASLIQVTLGSNVTNVQKDAFLKSKNIKKVEYAGSIDDWVQIRFVNGNATPLYNGTSLYISGQLATAVTITASKINDYAFYNCDNLTSVTIESSVKSIGRYAFATYHAIEKVYYTGDINGWVQIAFADSNANPLCKNPDFYIDNQLVTTATITAPVVNAYALDTCKSLTSLTIADSVESIGEYAFGGCPIQTATIPTFACSAISKTSLQTLVITSGQSIPANAFKNCSALTSVVIADSVTSIGANAFNGCNNLASITLSNGVTSIGADAFLGCPIQTATIPTFACSAIPKTSLRTLVITSGQSIPANAFSNCDSLITVTLGNSVTSIGANAFNGCDNLASITLGNGVTGIGADAFLGCFKLVEVINRSSHITVTKTEYENGCIGCYALSVSNCDDTYTTRVTTDTDGFVLYDDDTDKIVVAYVGTQTDITLPATATKIYHNAFYANDTIQSVAIPDSVTDIGFEAFTYCTNLTSVIIGDGVTDIGYGAFAYCTNLTSVIIGDGVTTIQGSAFNTCHKLARITIGKGVKIIGTLAFGLDYENLESITYNGTKAQWNNISKSYDSIVINRSSQDLHFYITCTDGKIKLF